MATMQPSQSAVPGFPVIVIGASAGGFEALKILSAALPAKLGAAVLIVWHQSADVTGILPQVLGRNTTMEVKHPENGELLEPDVIYIAPPDRHMTIHNMEIRLSKGPKENRFRPAIDPLFRSAAYYHGSKVIGVILTGYLDDGASGLWSVSEYGGVTVVQDPGDAEVRAMPDNAIRAVNVDHIVPLAGIAPLLTRLVKERAVASKTRAPDNKVMELEIEVAAQSAEIKDKIMQFGELTTFTCPDCHGTLSAIREGKIVRYRCHTGHAFTPGNLLASINDNIEESLYNTLRALEEKMALLNNMRDQLIALNENIDNREYTTALTDTKEKMEMVRELLEIEDSENPG